MNTLIKEINQLPFAEAYKLYNYLEQRFNFNSGATSNSFTKLDQETIDLLESRETEFQMGQYDTWENAKKRLLTL